MKTICANEIVLRRSAQGEGNVKMCKYPISNIQYPVSIIQ